MEATQRNAPEGAVCALDALEWSARARVVDRAERVALEANPSLELTRGVSADGDVGIEAARQRALDPGLQRVGWWNGELLDGEHARPGAHQRGDRAPLAGVGMSQAEMHDVGPGRAKGADVLPPRGDARLRLRCG